jgi:hypothetical protein
MTFKTRFIATALACAFGALAASRDAHATLALGLVGPEAFHPYTASDAPFISHSLVYSYNGDPSNNRFTSAQLRVLGANSTPGNNILYVINGVNWGGSVTCTVNAIDVINGGWLATASNTTTTSGRFTMNVTLADPVTTNAFAINVQCSLPPGPVRQSGIGSVYWIQAP